MMLVDHAVDTEIVRQQMLVEAHIVPICAYLRIIDLIWQIYPH